MPALLSLIKCKSLSPCLGYSCQEHKIRGFTHSPAGSNRDVTECSPKNVPEAQLLIFNSFVFQVLELFRELTYSLVCSLQRTEFSWQNPCCLLKTHHLSCLHKHFPILYLPDVRQQGLYRNLLFASLLSVLLLSQRNDFLYLSRLTPGFLARGGKTEHVSVFTMKVYMVTFIHLQQAQKTVRNFTKINRVIP